MNTMSRAAHALLLVLVASLPFELQFLPFFSNLQWLFLLLAAAALPLIVDKREILIQNRLVLAAVAFVAVHWLSAALADAFAMNALKAAIRVTVGFTLLCAAIVIRPAGPQLMRVWAIAAIAAGAYGILDFSGYGLSHLFRDQDFYVGEAVRLSGSFEYPNTAGAYFAMSLPLIWTAALPRWLRISGGLCVWIALLLTYSRGAALAVLAMFVVWALVRKSRVVLLPGVALPAVLALAMVTQPALFRRFLQVPEPQALGAEYEPEFNLLRHRPNDSGMMRIRVTNTGTDPWIPEGENRVTMAYRWYDLEQQVRVVPPTLLTPGSGIIAHGESAWIDAPFRTPERPGRYLLVWELNRRGSGWFSTHGVMPVVMETDIRQEAEVWNGQGDVSRWYRRENSSLFIPAPPVTRLDLWKVAWNLALEHPIVGAGPDNFRLLYGERLQLTTPAPEIRANNLYLELLAGTGLLGLGMFVFMMAAVRWNTGAACFALGVFLIHGFVDSFLMTTPIYFAWWILLACHLASDKGAPPPCSGGL